MDFGALRRDVMKSVVAALALGGLSAFGDWLWTHYIPDGAIVPGVVHGVVLFLALAAVLAWASEKATAWRFLLLSLPPLGLLLAASFYPIAMALGYLPGLLITWIGMWLGLAGLHNRARGNPERFSRALLRGTTAALLSGLAFGVISDIWTQPSPNGPNYLWHFLCWTFAFLPGFLALLVAQPDTTRRSP